MSVVVSYKRQAVVFVAMGIIALAATEAAVRLLDEATIPGCSFLDHDLYRDVPHGVKEDMCREYQSIRSYHDGRTYVPQPMSGTHVNIAEGGFRGDGPDTIDEGSYRIFMLGGSTTFGYVTVSDDLTIPALLEKKLRDSGLDARVINAGVSGATTHDERYRLERYAEEWRPDMVIMYDGVNEIKYQGATYEEFLDTKHWYRVGGGGGLHIPVPTAYESLVNTSNWGVVADFELADRLRDLPPINASRGELAGQRQWGPGIGITRLAIWLDYRTALGTIEFLRTITTPPPTLDRASEGDVPLGDPTPVIEHSLHDNWAAVCKLGETGGITTVNFLQPVLGTADRVISEHEEPSYYFLQPINLDPPTYVKAHQYLTNVTLDPTRYHPCKNVYDLRGTMDGMDYVTVYYDWLHMRGNGNDAVASAMHDIVAPLVARDMGA